MITDIKQTDTGDVDLSAGDISYTESTRQHQKDLLLADKGFYKETPEAGVGALNYINDSEPENLYRSIRKEFTRDGMKVIRVGMTNTEAYYEGN